MGISLDKNKGWPVMSMYLIEAGADMHDHVEGVALPAITVSSGCERVTL